MKPIIGKRVILFETEPREFPDFAELHRLDSKGHMQNMCLKKMTAEEATSYVEILVTTLQIIPFTVMTKEGKATRRAGYVYVSELSEEACTIAGIMGKDFLLGLSRQIRRGKYTYSEDSLRTLIGYLFERFPKMHRIQMDAVESNRQSIALIERTGFKREGVLRDYLHIDDGRESVVIHSLLRPEFEAQEKSYVTKPEETDNINTGVPQAHAA